MKTVQTVEEFNQIISEDKETIMIFTAGWCPDCRRLEMFIGDIMAEHTDKAWYEVDRDQFPELAEKYDVMGIPSLLLFKKGEKLAHLHSAHAKTPEQVREYLETLPV
ncbi:Thioredoxin-1 Trx-1 [Fictibacillus macauensis ZFHKF-1]|uniref:Thioredoxin-1 Trx-1 n=1 Tax=Fictibacillus macauensis ZFHKF-1 TaxID=1196324 RepID=I8AK97_9BACL|nr:thioredoxin family protein [Fictibacillus macauensis]EIT85964.1 Thioredoxin-1 Trx-1 [Fictibacillus macauensis ZFHKF-1]